MENFLRRCGESPSILEVENLKINTLKASIWKCGILQGIMYQIFPVSVPRISDISEMRLPPAVFLIP